MGGGAYADRMMVAHENAPTLWVFEFRPTAEDHGITALYRPSEGRYF